MGRLFGTDGIRGIANKDLTADLALSVGRALGKILAEGYGVGASVLIGKDTRESSDMLESAMAAGLSSMGCRVLRLGVIPTPAVALLTVKHSALAGVMISASHNPFEYNGIKIFGEEGVKLSDALEERIEDLVLGGVTESRDIGVISDLRDGREEYKAHILRAFGVDLHGLRVVIDTANGACCGIAGEVLEGLSCEVKAIKDTPDGRNINLRSGSTDMTALSEAVVKGGYDLGIAFDGDGDRCLAVDRYGRVVDGDEIMAILALDMKRAGRLRKNAVVGTVMTNLGFVDFCREHNIDFFSTKVGDRYVLEEMNQKGYSFGGEQSGHIIIRSHQTTGDGILTAVALLSTIRRSGKGLDELALVMKKYPQYIRNVEANDEEKIRFGLDSEIKEMIRSAEAKLAGLGRLVIRPSGTEPKIRIMIESKSDELARELIEGLERKITSRLRELG